MNTALLSIPKRVVALCQVMRAAGLSSTGLAKAQKRFLRRHKLSVAVVKPHGANLVNYVTEEAAHSVVTRAQRRLLRVTLTEDPAHLMPARDFLLNAGCSSWASGKRKAWLPFLREHGMRDVIHVRSGNTWEPYVLRSEAIPVLKAIEANPRAARHDIGHAATPAETVPVAAPTDLGVVLSGDLNTAFVSPAGDEFVSLTKLMRAIRPRRNQAAYAQGRGPFIVKHNLTSIGRSDKGRWIVSRAEAERVLAYRASPRVAARAPVPVAVEAPIASPTDTAGLEERLAALLERHRFEVEGLINGFGIRLDQTDAKIGLLLQEWGVAAA